MNVIKRIYQLIIDPKIPTLASALAFFFILGSGAFIFLFVRLFTYIPIDLVSFIDKYFNSFVYKDVLIYLIKHNLNIGYSILLIFTSIYSSSSLYYHFLNATELLAKRALKYSISKRIISIISVAIFLFIFTGLIIFLVIINFINSNIIRLISAVIILIILLLIIYLLNFIALGSYRLFDCYKGVIVSFIYFIIFTILFIIYLQLFYNFKAVFGVFSFFIIFMLYIYILSIGLLIGIYINCKKLDIFNYLFSK